MSIAGGDIIGLVSGGALEWLPPSTPPTISGTPTTLDTKLVPKVLALITKYGKSVLFKLLPSKSYDATKGTVTLGDEVQYAKYVIPPFQFNDKYIDGNLVQVGDMQIGLPASGLEFTPENNIRVIIDSVVWRIIRYSPIYTGTQIALYIFHLRK